MNRKEVILDFYNKVCKKAESKMLKTNELEGAHFAAMKEIINDIENKPDNAQDTNVAQIANEMEKLISEFPDEISVHTDWVKHWIRKLRNL